MLQLLNVSAPGKCSMLTIDERTMAVALQR
jgi:hypothetical protein